MLTRSDISKYLALPSLIAFLSLIGVLVSNAKPNVLFIAIDDMNDWTTLFDKSNPIKTPNLE
ncbi:MAG: hypothetical protein KJT03_22875, partial [Verrucomicrobiae bacterium]|nr:hypothetical protein [Verrucomicrobiae bacterium]